ncbi:MAG: hypothetical protein Q8R00_03690 [Candidatus Nanoarchaeia archaeon]|nr:hypothetical protein [Candidatus Nanoarchaeia archaeon]
MITAELQKIKQLKKSFHDELLELLAAIIRIIETKGEVNEAYINKAKKAAEGLRKIYQLEENTIKERTLKLLLIYLKRKDIEKLESELSNILDIIKKY